MTEHPDSSADLLRGRFDRLGVVISGLCMLHCVAGLFLIGVLGLGGGVLLNPAIHRFGLVAAFHCRHVHNRRGRTAPWPPAAARAGHNRVWRSWLRPSPAITAPSEALLTICGVVLVASAHIVNMRRNAC
jgi:hypothetical protein